jgi:GDSL-like Lipase/Acylhydrolase family
MNSEVSTSPQRWHLGVLLTPGLLILAGGLLAYLYALRSPEFDFGKRRLLIAAVAGASAIAAGLVLHRKAVRDYRTVQRNYWRTVLYCSLCVAAGPALTIFALDKAVGVFHSHSAPRPILVLHPCSQESYRTSEFAFTATTNALGMRDREIDLQQKTGLRILALGDSFTYGWGVADAAPWPKVVERRLAEKHPSAEILNFGCPGAGVDSYARIAESVIPIAKPDVVLVAVLQGIDLKLANLGETSDRLFQARVDRNGRDSGSVVARVFPNLCDLRARLAARRPQVISADEIRQQWQAMARSMSNHFSHAEAEHFDRLDAEVKEMFRVGDLNPWEVYFALKYPDYVSFTLRPDRPEVRRAIDSMAHHLTRIRRAADAINAQTIVLCVPPAWYYSARALAAKRRVGYDLDDSAIKSDAPDDAIRSACQSAGVEFRSYASRFRHLPADEKWYFDLDGMYNAKGQALFAEAVAEDLERILK